MGTSLWILILGMGTSLWILFLGIVTYCVNIIPRVLDMSKHQPLEASEVTYSETYPPSDFIIPWNYSKKRYSGNLVAPLE